MAIVSMKALLESGVHFGHRTNKWDPRMKPYIFTERNGIHIIDLQQTVKLLAEAYTLIRDTVAEGGTILFVGTKRQAQETILDEATRCGMPYVIGRWLGGTLTNWSTIYQRVQELERLENLRESEEINLLTKKEGLMIDRQIDRLEGRLSGIRDMKRLPDLLFVVDINREDSAVHEANLLNIPIVALVDTNCNPLDIDYVIPSNDDAIRAIKLLVSKVADAVLEGKSIRKEDEARDEEMAQVGAEDALARKEPRQEDVDDQDVEEEDLLGEATLAKLSASRKSTDEEEQEDRRKEEEQKAKEKEEAKTKSRGRKEKEKVIEGEVDAEPVEEKAEAAEEPESKDEDLKEDKDTTEPETKEKEVAKEKETKSKSTGRKKKEDDAEDKEKKTTKAKSSSKKSTAKKKESAGKKVTEKKTKSSSRKKKDEDSEKSEDKAE